MLFSSLLSLVPLLSLVSAYKPLSDNTLKRLPGPGKDFDIKDGAILAPILRTRVSGTPGSTAVLQHFVDFFKKELPTWKLEFHNSTSTTPTSNGKKIPFINLIATRDPPGMGEGDVGRLAVVAHYDSKLTPDGFIGATDSAAPCAMILHAARSIDKALTKKWEAAGGSYNLDEEQQGVQILLLDGEEAFQSWTDTDSLYGARALAEDWEFSYHPAMSTFRTPLNSIELFLLLDLLGSRSPSVPSYFKTTHWAYKHMANVERRLRELGSFKSSPNHPKNMAKRKNKKPRIEPNFLPEADKNDDNFMGGFVEDDHVPFMARGVEILHIIPAPFPRVWHTMDDDGAHLDADTVEDWARLVTAFMAEWMELEGFFDFPQERRKTVYEEKTEL
ncbi:glutaminyl-peptide cyclotransferase precursor [Dendryphion nanum]|uniref:Peptide hydrolase n=1 Tax=Dendryphion nanum TaxID=256645 RepID=A0A9P9DIL1_9PLEO|nr:glutaminyl-peptide cyclotransferase precursor [Dendryphion nanum]